MSPLHHAYLLKGWLLGRDVPPEVSEALRLVIEALGEQDERLSISGATIPDAIEAIIEAQPLGQWGDRSELRSMSDETAADLTLDVEEMLQPGQPKPRKKNNMSPEARAAAAERMRAMQAKKRAEREAASPTATEPEPAPHVDPASLRITVSKPRRKSRLTDADWLEIKGMLAAGRSRVSIASDFDEAVDDLDDFILAQQHREGKSPGEAAASPFNGTSDATRRPT